MILIATPLPVSAAGLLGAASVHPGMLAWRW
jgi:hypothetical protein